MPINYRLLRRQEKDNSNKNRLSKEKDKFYQMKEEKNKEIRRLQKNLNNRNQKIRKNNSTISKQQTNITQLRNQINKIIKNGNSYLSPSRLNDLKAYFKKRSNGSISSQNYESLESLRKRRNYQKNKKIIKNQQLSKNKKNNYKSLNTKNNSNDIIFLRYQKLIKYLKTKNKYKNLNSLKNGQNKNLSYNKILLNLEDIIKRAKSGFGDRKVLQEASKIVSNIMNKQKQRNKTGGAKKKYITNPLTGRKILKNGLTARKLNL